VSEIVGIGAEAGVKTASRLDPTQISSGVKIYHDPKDAGEWTSAERVDVKKAKPFNRGGAKEAGRPAAINHGNIPPTIETDSGGVTIEYALHTVVLSLPSLRRLRFTARGDGTAFKDRGTRDAAELAARTALAALSLAAIVHQHERGYDLRSRSLLIGTGPLRIERVRRDGVAEVIDLDRDSVNALVAEATAAAASLGLPWDGRAIDLVPAPKLADVIRQSRKLAQSTVDEVGEDS
jgi:CRISPR-associated protein Csb1